MKNTKKVESGKGLKIFINILLSLLLLGFAGLAIHNICTLTTRLDEKTSTVEQLETEKQEQEQNLQKLEEEKNNLNTKKEELEKKNKELEDKLQAKLEAQKKTQQQAQQATLASQTTVTGTCADWMRAAGITDTQNASYIFQRESGCNPKAVNASSGAYGVCQALPGNKMASAGSDWQTNPVTQMKWCNTYAKQRYGSWANAVAFWKTNKWW